MIEFDGFLSIFAGMFKIDLGMKKHIYIIGIWITVFLLAVIMACNPPKKKTLEPMGKPISELATIDSLMWWQPDSAYARLKVFVVSPEAKDLDEFNGHYCQLLISELLYKNDCEQKNREDLLEAVGYFDSIDDGFLAARAHYINGVGFYEKGDMVNACAEYLKTLEVMEEHFEEKELVRHKARFLAYTYNRLGDLFSEQFMMESAIKCYENALFYCEIEPTSSSGISNVLYRIGKQYDKIGEKNKANEYYTMALEKMPSRNNLLFRDLVSTKALCEYKLGFDHKQSLDKLKQILMLADNESEYLFRFLIIGGIYYEEKFFDSALYYLEPVFKNKEDIGLRAEAANTLCAIYESIGDKENATACISFLAENKKLDWENKSLVSKLEEMFKTYMNQKQEKDAEAKHKMAINRVLGIIIPIVIALVLIIIVLAKLRSKKLLKEQQEEADRLLGETEQEHEKELRLWQAEADKTLEETKKKYEEELRQLKAETEQRLEDVERKHQQWMAEARERHEEELKTQKDKSDKEIEKTKKRHAKELEAERLAYEKEQDALRQNLKEREAQVIALEKTLNLQQKAAKQRRMAFLKEPICQRILNDARNQQITTRDVAHELGIALKDKDYKQLGEAVEKHYEGFDHELLSRCPSLKQGLLSLCHLHLLGLNESEIAALKNLSYSAIKKQNDSLQEKLGVEESVAKYVMRVAEGLVGHYYDVLKLGLMPESLGSSQKSSQKNSQKIVDLIKGKPEITTTEMAEIVGLTRRSIVNITNKLQEESVIRRVGPDKGGHWEVIE